MRYLIFNKRFSWTWIISLLILTIIVSTNNAENNEEKKILLRFSVPKIYKENFPQEENFIHSIKMQQSNNNNFPPLKRFNSKNEENFLNKRKFSNNMGFFGMRGKKNQENVPYDYYYNKGDDFSSPIFLSPRGVPPVGFFGMRGKKLNLKENDNVNNKNINKRSYSGFFGMRGKKGDENNATTSENFRVENQKRTPLFGFFDKKRLSGFFGMRGKKYPYQFKGKFIGVRGKKSLNNDEEMEIKNNRIKLDNLDLNDQLLLLLLTEENQ